MSPVSKMCLRDVVRALQPESAWDGICRHAYERAKEDLDLGGLWVGPECRVGSMGGCGFSRRCLEWNQSLLLQRKIARLRGLARMEGGQGIMLQSGPGPCVRRQS